MRRQALVQAQIEEVLAELDDEDDERELPIPDNLIARITKRLKDEPALRWDAALREIAENDQS